MKRNILLECSDVIKIYESQESKIKVPALRGIDLTIHEGDLIAIIGPSGVGKTTLFNILGLLDRPSSGEIILNSQVLGRIIYSRTPSDRFITIRRQIFGFLFQLPDKNLLFHRNALENIIFPMKVIDKYAREERIRRAHELLRMLGLEKRKNHKPPQLSGGEAQRLGICVALAIDPQIILADEPTGELDSLNTMSIINYFRELNNELGKTFIIVTHDPRFQTMTDITYSMLDGKITSLHKPKDEKESYQVREEFTYVSNDGGLKIPNEYLRRYKISRIVILEPAENGFKVIPVDEEEKKENVP
ncbi:MAG: ABC transporter ATP-binding protein [Candidatus Hodarchaeota archaeon]